ncbi:unnamed protein product [Oikopleura dioica]|uniref:Uncharacterized protein n=1 Tax=Oikopleura dioica TaxID=34765 RepID=E4XYC9_OIKDI|nr:unnamed protein product [Oikopleura dioica]
MSANKRRGGNWSRKLPGPDVPIEEKDETISQPEKQKGWNRKIEVIPTTEDVDKKKKTDKTDVQAIENLDQPDITEALTNMTETQMIDFATAATFSPPGGTLTGGQGQAILGGNAQPSFFENMGAGAAYALGGTAAITGSCYAWRKMAGSKPVFNSIAAVKNCIFRKKEDNPAIEMKKGTSLFITELKFNLYKDDEQGNIMTTMTSTPRTTNLARTKVVEVENVANRTDEIYWLSDNESTKYYSPMNSFTESDYDRQLEERMENLRFTGKNYKSKRNMKIIFNGNIAPPNSKRHSDSEPSFSPPSYPSSFGGKKQRIKALTPLL